MRDRDHASSVALCLLLLSFTFLAAFFHISSVDPGVHLRTGSHILETGKIPATNTFSHTMPDHIWLVQQWWPAVLYYLVYEFGGLSLLIIFKSLIICVIFSLVYLAARDASARHSLWPMWAVLIGVMMSRLRFFLRPFLVSALLFALVMYLDSNFGRKKRWQLLALPLLMTLWANTHAGVMYGYVLLSTWIAAEWIAWIYRRARAQTAEPMRELFIRPASMLLSLIGAYVSLEAYNPNGFRVILMPIDQLLNPFWQKFTAEFASPGWSGFELFYSSLGALLLLHLIAYRYVRLRPLLATCVFAILALRSQRSILFFVLAAAPYACQLLESRWPTDKRRTRMVHGILIPLTCLALAFGVITRDKTLRTGIGTYHGFYPHETIGFIKTHVASQNMFHDLRFCGAMLWHLYPDFKTFVEGRNTAYSVEFMRDEYLPAVLGETAWSDVFEKYGVTAAFLRIEPDGSLSKLATTLFSHPDWALVMYDQSALFFLQRNEKNNEVIQQHEFTLTWPGNWTLDTLSSEKAFREAERAYRNAPDSVFCQTAYARGLLTRELYDPAARIYAKLVALDGASDDYWRDYGYALYMSQQMQEASKVFDRMISKNTAPAYAFYMKHFIALQHDDLNTALKMLKSAARVEPENDTYRSALAELSALNQAHTTVP